MSTSRYNKELCNARRQLPPVPEASGSRGSQDPPAPSPWERPLSSDWPAHREARGELTLKATADHRRSLRAVCSIKNGVLTLTVEGSSAVVAEVPVAELAVGLQRGCNNMFMIATVYQSKMFDEIFCFADDQVKRNKWIAVFRRMGVPVSDLSTA
jgi:hypothetical protein